MYYYSQPAFEGCSFISQPEFFSEGVLGEILPVAAPVALALIGTQPGLFAQDF